MKLTLTMIALISGIMSSMTTAQAYPGGGGWDGNNVRVSVGHSKLLPAAEQKTSKDASKPIPGGGWDANNVRVSVSHSKLLSH